MPEIVLLYSATQPRDKTGKWSTLPGFTGGVTDDAVLKKKLASLASQKSNAKKAGDHEKLAQVEQIIGKVKDAHAKAKSSNNLPGFKLEDAEVGDTVITPSGEHFTITGKTWASMNLLDSEGTPITAGTADVNYFTNIGSKLKKAPPVSTNVGDTEAFAKQAAHENMLFVGDKVQMDGHAAIYKGVVDGETMGFGPGYFHHFEDAKTKKSMAALTSSELEKIHNTTNEGALAKNPLTAPKPMPTLENGSTYSHPHLGQVEVVGTSGNEHVQVKLQSGDTVDLHVSHFPDATFISPPAAKAAGQNFTVAGHTFTIGDTAKTMGQNEYTFTIGDTAKTMGQDEVKILGPSAKYPHMVEVEYNSGTSDAYTLAYPPSTLIKSGGSKAAHTAAPASTGAHKDALDKKVKSLQSIKSNAKKAGDHDKVAATQKKIDELKAQQKGVATTAPAAPVAPVHQPKAAAPPLGGVKGMTTADHAFYNNLNDNVPNAIKKKQAITDSVTAMDDAKSAGTLHEAKSAIAKIDSANAVVGEALSYTGSTKGKNYFQTKIDELEGLKDQLETKFGLKPPPPAPGQFAQHSGISGVQAVAYKPPTQYSHNTVAAQLANGASTAKTLSKYVNNPKQLQENYETYVGPTKKAIAAKLGVSEADIEGAAMQVQEALFKKSGYVTYHASAASNFGNILTANGVVSQNVQSKVGVKASSTAGKSSQNHDQSNGLAEHIFTSPFHALSHYGGSDPLVFEIDLGYAKHAGAFTYPGDQIGVSGVNSYGKKVVSWEKSGLVGYGGIIAQMQNHANSSSKKGMAGLQDIVHKLSSTSQGPSGYELMLPDVPFEAVKKIKVPAHVWSKYKSQWEKHPNWAAIKDKFAIG